MKTKQGNESDLSLRMSDLASKLIALDPLIRMSGFCFGKQADRARIMAAQCRATQQAHSGRMVALEVPMPEQLHVMGNGHFRDFDRGYLSCLFPGLARRRALCCALATPLLIQAFVLLALVSLRFAMAIALLSLVFLLLCLILSMCMPALVAALIPGQAFFHPSMVRNRACSSFASGVNPFLSHSKIRNLRAPAHVWSSSRRSIGCEARQLHLAKLPSLTAHFPQAQPKHCKSSCALPLARQGQSLAQS